MMSLRQKVQFCSTQKSGIKKKKGQGLIFCAKNMISLLVKPKKLFHVSDTRTKILFAWTSKGGYPSWYCSSPNTLNCKVLMGSIDLKTLKRVLEGEVTTPL